MPRGSKADSEALWESFVKKYRDDPVAFVEEVVGMTPDPWQRELLEAVANGETRLSVASGHGVGKSTVISWLCVWTMATCYPYKIVATAPTATQLYDALYSEIKSTFKKLPKIIQNLFEIKSDRIELKAAKQDCFLSCRTSSKERPEAMAGVHSAGRVLLLADEASGIPEEVFTAASGSLSTHGSIIVLTGNPVRTQGLFYDTHHKLKKSWWTRTVSCEDSSLVTPSFIEDMAERYGRDSNSFRVRVQGLFPLSDEDTLIPRYLVEAAINRDIEPSGTTVWGVDVARMGADRSVICKRRGNVVMEIKTFRDMDLMSLCGAIVNEYRLSYGDNRPETINVDGIGLGAGVADRLIELGLPASAVNVSESAAAKQQYNRLRDELWDKCREWFADRMCCIPENEDLVNDLIAPTYSFMSSGKLKVEAKDEMRRRHGRSPDVADALVLTFASDAAVMTHGSDWAAGTWKKPLVLEDYSWVV